MSMNDVHFHFISAINGEKTHDFEGIATFDGFTLEFKDPIQETYHFEKTKQGIAFSKSGKTGIQALFLVKKRTPIMIQTMGNQIELALECQNSRFELERIHIEYVLLDQEVMLSRHEIIVRWTKKEGN